MTQGIGKHRAPVGRSSWGRRRVLRASTKVTCGVATCVVLGGLTTVAAVATGTSSPPPVTVCIGAGQVLTYHADGTCPSGQTRLRLAAEAAVTALSRELTAVESAQKTDEAALQHMEVLLPGRVQLASQPAISGDGFTVQIGGSNLKPNTTLTLHESRGEGPYDSTPAPGLGMVNAAGDIFATQDFTCADIGSQTLDVRYTAESWWGTAAIAFSTRLYPC
jgi:hypothetical protein